MPRPHKQSGTIENGKVRVSGINGPARFVRSKIAGVSIEDHGDGTIDIVLPDGMTPAQAAFVHWEDDDGPRATACTFATAPEPTIEERLTALEEA